MDYYKDTPPLEFIGDVYDIMKDGDCLTPEKLKADVVDMLGKYLSAQQSVHRTAIAACNCPAFRPQPNCPIRGGGTTRRR